MYFPLHLRDASPQCCLQICIVRAVEVPPEMQAFFLGFIWIFLDLFGRQAELASARLKP
jgi:hypothetical protein